MVENVRKRTVFIRLRTDLLFPLAVFNTVLAEIKVGKGFGINEYPVGQVLNNGGFLQL
ncbi:hypothetical protein SAMN05216436_12843 [bacterium A37T11]|nr:hypothetical protein SAMN05216436_12843 [bacterium A37T11]